MSFPWTYMTTYRYVKLLLNGLAMPHKKRDKRKRKEIGLLIGKRIAT